MQSEVNMTLSRLSGHNINMQTVLDALNRLKRELEELGCTVNLNLSFEFGEVELEELEEREL